jgi:hypothetical protein
MKPGKVETDDERYLRTTQAETSGELNIQLTEEDWGYLSEMEIEGIRAGLEDLEAGRVYSHENVMAHINKKLNSVR